MQRQGTFCLLLSACFNPATLPPEADRARDNYKNIHDNTLRELQVWLAFPRACTHALAVTGVVCARCRRGSRTPATDCVRCACGRCGGGDWSLTDRAREQHSYSEIAQVLNSFFHGGGGLRERLLVLLCTHGVGRRRRRRRRRLVHAQQRCHLVAA